jgi:uncharacterized glyoxalase superfamily protein PhnB
MPTDVATITPSLRYKDAPAAIAWLEKAFGFQRHLVVTGDDPQDIVHAQLTYGNGMLMLGSARENAWDRLQATVAQAGGRATACLCVLVADADQHYQQAVAAGAEIVDPITDKEYGGRGYGCRDLEGNLWFFGTYNPWA